MRRSLLMLPLLVFLMAVAMADPFEGTKWKVKVTPDEDARAAGEKEFDDVLIFKGGKFTATECKKYGFGPVDYEEDTRRGPVAKFTAEPTSEKEGKAKWSGTLTGADMTGELVWTKKDGTVLHYAFKGERMPPG